MKTSPRPSVAAIVAARDSEATIEAAIGSLLAQTIPLDEIVLVSDGSIDDTATRSARLLGSRGIVIELPVSVGRGAARNLAAKSTDAELLLICDADDVSTPTRLESLLAGIRANGAQIIGGQALTLTPKGRRYGRTRMPLDANECRRLALAGLMPVVHPSCLIDHAAFDSVGGYEPTLARAQDLHLVMRMSLAGGRIANVPETVLKYTYPRLISFHRYVEEQRWANVAREMMETQPMPSPNLLRWISWTTRRLAREARESLLRPGETGTRESEQ